jgi:hypothetical protein
MFRYLSMRRIPDDVSEKLCRPPGDDANSGCGTFLC